MEFIFLTYESKQRKKIDALIRQLEDEGYQCKRNSDSAGEAGTGDDKNIKKAGAILLCVDGAFLENEYCVRDTFLSHGFGKPVIVLRFENIILDASNSRCAAVLSSCDTIDFYIPNDPSNESWPSKSMAELLGKLDRMPLKRGSPAGGPEEKENRVTSQKRSQILTSARPTTSRLSLLPFHVALLCSTDKLKVTNAIAVGLEYYGYSCKVFDYIEHSVSKSPKFKAAIVCLSDRFTKSHQGTNEVIQCDNMKKPILTLLMDHHVKWPPKNQASYIFRRHRPVDCSDRKSEDDWRGETKEMKAIISELQYLIPEVKAQRFPTRRVRSTSPQRRPRSQTVNSPSNSINLPPINRARSHPRRGSRYGRTPNNRPTFGRGPARPITAASLRANIRSRYRQSSATYSERIYREGATYEAAEHKLPSAYRRARTPVY